MQDCGRSLRMGRTWLPRVLAILVAGLPLAALSSPVLPPRAADLLRGSDGAVPDRLAGFPLVSAFAEDWGVRYLFTLDPAAPEGANLVELVVSGRDDAASAVARTRSSNVAYKGPMEGGAPAARVRPLVDALVAAVERNESGMAPIVPVPVPAPPEASQGPAGLSSAMAWAGILLVLAFLLASPVTALRLGRDLRAALGPSWWVLLVVIGAGLAARLLVPHRPVMYYMGYRMAEVAARLDDVPKYGSGALALYHLLFRLTGPSHLAMIGLNAVLGGLLPATAAGLVARLGGGRIAVAAAALLVAATPAFVRDSATESLLVPSLLWTATGLWLLARWRGTRAPSDLVLAALHLVLAVFSRPEAVGLVPFAAAVLIPFALPERGRAPSHARAATAAVIAVVAALLALRVAHLLVSVGRELDLGNTPVLSDPAALAALVPDLVTRNLALRPGWFPAGVSAVAFLPLFLGPRRARSLALLAVAVAWLAVSLVDLPHVSLPRVQVPGLFFLAVAAAFGLDAAWARRGSGATGRAVRWAVGLSATLAVVTSIPFSGAAFQERTNADDEEDLLREAVALLPAEPVVFVRRSYDDQPVERVHLHYPDYGLRPPFRDDLVIGPDRLAATDPVGRPVYFYLGTRCFLRECDQVGMHPACRRMRDEYRLEPVFERAVPVRRIPLDRKVRPDGDLDFPWCVAAGQSMRLGLYRVFPKPAGEGGHPTPSGSPGAR